MQKITQGSGGNKEIFPATKSRSSAIRNTTA
jgi:hypothetical protein